MSSNAPELPFRSDVKSPAAFRTIAEVAAELDLPQHVLRFWETKFPQIKPLKRRGGRRYYRPDDIELLRCIKRLLHVDGFTIRGAQKLLRERSANSRATKAADEPAPLGESEAPSSGHPPADQRLREETLAVLAELEAVRRLLHSGQS